MRRLLSLLLLVTLVSCTPVSAYAQNHTIAPGQWFGCPVKTDFERASLYLSQGDRGAAAQVVVNSRCVLFTTGEMVYRTDVSIFSGTVRVRRRGSTGEYWTNMEAVGWGFGGE